MKYQIYCDRGQGLSLEGCWGSEHAQFKKLQDSMIALQHLAYNYPDCDWVLVENHKEINRIVAKSLTNNV